MIDIDRKNFATLADMRAVVDGMTAVLKRAQFTCHEETSTNGGAHLWIFLSESVPYQLMTDVLKVFTAEAGHPNLETYPVGDKGAEGKWVYMPYAGAEQDEDRLGLTYLRDPENGWPIPAWALAQAVQRVSVGSFLAVLARKPHVPQQDAKQTAAHDLAPDGYALLVAATLTPPAGFERHNSAEAFLNLAERMGKQDDMAEHLKSDVVYATWFPDVDRTLEVWAKEIDRWIVEGKSDRQYGISFLTDQGWQLPDLPKRGQQATARGKQNWQQAFNALQAKYLTTQAGEKRKRVQFLRPSEFRQIPRPEPLVEGMLVRRSLCALVGESGAGKSMVALDVAMHVALGREWHGRKVVQGNVAFVAAEADAETAHRFFGWCNRAKVNPDKVPLYLGPTSLAFTDVEEDGGLDELLYELKGLEQQVGSLELIVVDTVARTFGEGDENSNSDMVRYSNCAELLARVFNCTVWLIHHTGKNAENGARGASAFKAPLEMEITLSRGTGKDKGLVVLRQSKNRGGTEDAKLPQLSILPHTWEQDGEPVSAGVVAAGNAVTFAAEMLPPQQQQVLSSLLELYSEENRPINRSEWHECCEKDDIPKRRVNEHIKALIECGHVREVVAGKTFTPAGDGQ